MLLILLCCKQIRLDYKELNHIILFFGVMAASNCSGVILKSVSTDVGTSTGTPPDNFTISKYETQYGAGKITDHHRLHCNVIV
jgi:hypothetical protein